MNLHSNSFVGGAEWKAMVWVKKWGFGGLVSYSNKYCYLSSTVPECLSCAYNF